MRILRQNWRKIASNIKTIKYMDRPNRMELQSADGAQLNLDALYQIAPSCFTEVADTQEGGGKTCN